MTIPLINPRKSIFSWKNVLQNTDFPPRRRNRFGCPLAQRFLCRKSRNTYKEFPLDALRLDRLSNLSNRRCIQFWRSSPRGRNLVLGQKLSVTTGRILCTIYTHRASLRIPHRPLRPYKQFPGNGLTKQNLILLHNASLV